MAEALAAASAAAPPAAGSADPASRRRRASTPARGALVAARPPAGDRPRGAALAWAAALLDRYGVLTRETVALDPWAPPWRDLAPWLARAELRGELRRGYFVEGLSGVQYASAEAADELARLAAAPDAATAPPVLISTLDPANLYGSGAPLDIELLEGGTARLPRSPANFLVLIARPAGPDRRGVRQAADRPGLGLRGRARRLPWPCCRPWPARRGGSSRSRPTTPPPPWPAPPPPGWPSSGFVRDYPGMAYYAGW